MKSRIYCIIITLILAANLLYAQQDANRKAGGKNPRDPELSSGVRADSTDKNDNLSGKDITTNPPKPNVNTVMDNFFPPEMVMRKQKEIGLNEDQQKAIKDEMKKTLARFTELEWERSAEEETMISIAKQNPVDEKKALAQFEKILSIEDSIKKVHLEMLIKVRNILTAEQQAKLFEIRKQKEALSGKQEQRRNDNQMQQDRPRRDENPRGEREGNPPADKRQNNSPENNSPQDNSPRDNQRDQPKQKPPEDSKR